MINKKSEILKELEDNVKELKKLINTQTFSVGDAEFFLKRYFNIIRAFEDLVKSRDRWKWKFESSEKELAELVKELAVYRKGETT